MTEKLKKLDDGTMQVENIIETTKIDVHLKSDLLAEKARIEKLLAVFDDKI